MKKTEVVGKKGVRLLCPKNKDSQPRRRVLF